MDSHEIEELYLRLGPLIYRRCLRLLGNPENARDATQEVFVRALHHARELVWDRGCLPWLYRVATNHCLNRIRDSRPIELREPDALPERGDGKSTEDWMSARRTVLSLLKQVDEETSQIAVYALLDGMTQDEIAGVMNLSRRTVGKKLALFEEKAKTFLQGEPSP